MSSWLKKLSKIDDRTKLAVYGWVSNEERLLHLNHIPIMISSICVLYFYDDEIFEVPGGCNVILKKWKKYYMHNIISLAW